VNVRQVIPRDAIPSVDDPAFLDEYTGPATDDVVAVEVAGEARAYPVRYLHYHEIVNDTLAGTPIAVTWCPLCGSAVVYDRRVGGERAEDAASFGVSGKLADDDLVMYDRTTDSEWKQSSGRCIAGPHKGAELRILPAALTTWSAFREQYPDGSVLAPPGGKSEASGPGDDPEPIDYDVGPYETYFEVDGFGLGAHRGTGDTRSWNRTDIDAKTVVLGVEVGDEALGVPLPVVEAEGSVVTTTVADTDVVVFATDDGIHAFEHPGFEFVAEDIERGRFAADDASWNGATGESDDGRSLARLPTRRLFAFAWQDDHGPDAFYGLE
jgi:hypothetical protein